MKKIHYIFHLLTLICAGGVIYLLTSNEESKTVYFSSAQVYNEFDYKKELELELEQVQNQGKRTLDSLELDLSMTMDALKLTEPTQEQLILFERKQQGYMEFARQLEEGYALKSQEYYNQIWDRINTYVREYGEEQGYKYIFGANGDGSIMYAEEKNDITTDIIQLINQKYAGE